MADDNRGWHGASEGHSEAGRKGGQASQGGSQNQSTQNQSTTGQGNQNAAENLTSEDRSKGGKAAHEKGTAHEFTSEEAREAGRKGGSQ